LALDDRFLVMFFEEARELLLSLEQGLMELERRQEDREHLDRTFRAAHSIKGAAAMVGLKSLAEFTHAIEAVLDRIRSKTLAVDSYVISTLLEARDHLSAAIEAEAARSPIPAPPDLTSRLSGLVQDQHREAPPAPRPAPPQSARPSPISAEQVPEPPVGEKRGAIEESSTPAKRKRRPRASRAKAKLTPAERRDEADAAGRRRNCSRQRVSCHARSWP